MTESTDKTNSMDIYTMLSNAIIMSNEQTIIIRALLEYWNIDESNITYTYTEELGVYEKKLVNNLLKRHELTLIQLCSV